MILSTHFASPRLVCWGGKAAWLELPKMGLLKGEVARTQPRLRPAFDQEVSDNSLQFQQSFFQLCVAHGISLRKIRYGSCHATLPITKNESRTPGQRPHSIDEQELVQSEQ